MNRRGFLSLLGLAPVVAVGGTVPAPAVTTVTIHSGPYKIGGGEHGIEGFWPLRRDSNGKLRCVINETSNTNVLDLEARLCTLVDGAVASSLADRNAAS